MWAIPWADYDLVYLFQRPESMGLADCKYEKVFRQSREFCPRVLK